MRILIAVMLAAAVVAQICLMVMLRRVNAQLASAKSEIVSLREMTSGGGGSAQLSYPVTIAAGEGSATGGVSTGGVLTITAASVDDWRPMSSAPRDGTIIETKNDYGIMPWYGLHKWARMTHGDGHAFGEKVWVSVDQPSTFMTDENQLTWRPYHGDPAHYDDPTHGAQLTNGYWTRGIK